MIYIFRKIIRKFPGRIIKLVKLPNPDLLEGFSCRDQLGKICKANNYNNVLIVTDKTLFSLGFYIKCADSLKEEGINYEIFNDISSEPNYTIIDNGLAAARKMNADCIVALGGGSVLDSCKMISCGVKTKKNAKKLRKKFLFAKKKALPMISIPTTAGTGAEITVGAVITNPKGKKTSTVVVGLNVTYVILDSELTINAPANVTAACAIDALSHSLEGTIASIKVKAEDHIKDREGVKLVLENLPILLKNPHDVEARQRMCKAAYYGGNAINKQLCGWVHAFAHSIGAYYHIPHGNAIAMALIPVIENEKLKCITSLALCAKHCGIDDSDPLTAADLLLQKIDELINSCNIKYKDLIKEEDYKKLTKLIISDSINYSSPKALSKKEVFSVLDKIKRG